MKCSHKDIFVIGFALFSMFFGAGNVIFPPYLGLSCGRQWFLGFACYYLADIGLALAALFAVLRSGSPEHMTRRIGKAPSTLLMSAIILCIGPMLAIPRTAATTYEMALAPLAAGFSPVLFRIKWFCHAQPPVRFLGNLVYLASEHHPFPVSFRFIDNHFLFKRFMTIRECNRSANIKKQQNRSAA